MAICVNRKYTEREMAATSAALGKYPQTSCDNEE